MHAQLGGKKLRAIGFGKIEVHIARWRLVAWGRHVEPLQRIGFIAAARFIEIIAGIGKLRGEFRDEVRANFVAASANRRTDRGEEISGLAAQFQAHPANRLFGNPGQRAFPTRMNGGDGAFLRVNEKNGNAVGRLHAEQQAGVIRGGGVALAGVRGRGGEKVDSVGVNLLERRERERFSAQGGLPELAILGDVFACVPLHEAKIQNLLAFEGTDPAGTRAESVDEPGKFAEGRELKNLQAAGMAHHPGSQKKKRGLDGAFAVCRLFRR